MEAVAGAMRVVVSEIPEDGVRLVERLDSAALALDTPEVAFVAPLGVSAFVQRHEDELLVWVEADSTVAMVCGRCLTTVQQPYRATFDLTVEVAQRPTVELTDEIRQEIVLSYPMTALCRDDCRGLCPTCGHNLNEGVCSHGTA